VISRLFTVLAAVLFLATFGLGILLPRDLSLAQAVNAMDPALFRGLQHSVVNAVGQRAWVHVAVPLLVRPAWLIPACLALIATGAAATTATPRKSTRTTRRRS